MFGSVVGAILILIACGVGVVYQRYAQKSVPSKIVETGNPAPGMTRKDMMVPVPEKLDDITATITAESADDFSALDEEIMGVEAEIDLDSESVTNLGTSYDETSF